MRDFSNGYEAVAAEFVSHRATGDIGVSTVRQWARTLPAGSSVLDVGCGAGVPITRALVSSGLDVYGVDASPKMVAAFRRNLPAIPVACGAVEDFDFFGRRFDAVISWGLLFLLREESQIAVISRIAAVLNRGGSFLFTAPRQECTWIDVLTRRPSTSLGLLRYTELLCTAGLQLVAEYDDEGGNHYYHAVPA